MKKIIALALSALIVLTCCACGGTADENVLKIGYFGNLVNADGKLQKETIELFVEKWNKEKTFGDITVQLVAYDNTNNGVQDTEMSIKATQKLLHEDNVQIIIPAQLSNIIQATGEIINSEKVLSIGLGLSATWMQQGWDYVYRTALNNDYQVPSLTKTMNELGQNKVAVLYHNTDNCLTFRDNFVAACADANVTITAEQKVTEGETNLTGPITALLESDPDCVFITFMGGNFGTAVKQIRQLGFEGMIYLGQNLIATEVETIGDDEVNGVAFCSPYVSYTNIEDCTNDYIKNALQTFYDKYNYVPQDDQFYKTWDACLLIENAVKAANSTDTEKIQAAISGLKVEGCAGTMDFTTGSNECYFSARAWVYTGRGAAGAPVVMEDWLEMDLAEKIPFTAE